MDSSPYFYTIGTAKRMITITKKSEIQKILNICITEYNSKDLTGLVESVNTLILQHKVKFPLLEYTSIEILKHIQKDEIINFTDKVSDLNTEGGNVILGMMLQKYAEINYDKAIEKACKYISRGKIWYCSDIIGERVFGVCLLKYPVKTIKNLDNLSNHDSNFVVRSIGAGIHYATKKGIDKEFIPKLFSILLTNSASKDKEIQKGMGWAAKTIMKFHPQTYDNFKDKTNNFQSSSNWFRKKIQIGLDRSQIYP